MKKNYICILMVMLFFACNTEEEPFFTQNQNNTSNQIGDVNDNDSNDDNDNASSENTEDIKILSLGDSYTIGQSVCATCRFPVQLKDSLINLLNRDGTVEIIAQTGWTTTNLLEGINAVNPASDHNLVTLLIGVNNQFQGKPFSLYEQEFPTLVNRAITFANGNSNNVIVVSIPDYAYTPFGQNFGNPLTTSSEIDAYNAFAQSYCGNNGITFLNITDITREGLDNPNLVASDNLHPSELAYSKFVQRLIPIAIEKLE